MSLREEVKLWYSAAMNTDPFSIPPRRDDIVSRKELNESQYQAVTTIDGPVLVIAGAGSGKTRTLVYRVAHLVAEGVAPENILLLTFTRKASQEMLWRAGQLLGGDCNRVVGGTFHSVANMLLRRFGSSLGFSSSFSIIDRADAEGIVHLLKSSLDLGKKEKRFPKKRAIINMISGAVNKSFDLETLISEQYGHLLDYLDDLLLLAKHYRQFKFDHGLMDYDDLLVNWQRLLKESDEARQKIARRFSHIMVDEYQDTNLIQADIVRGMAEEHNNVMVVGDDSQSIYSFRGADFYNIMRFPDVFPQAKVIKLEENYRSTQPILSLTNGIIENAAEKYTKSLYSSIEGEELPHLYAGRDEHQEADFIVGRMKELVASGVPLSEIAVLFRSGFHSYKLELALTSERFEYEKRGGQKLTESAHIKDIIAFLRVLVNPDDTLSWNRILLQLEGVGPATAQKISGIVAGAENLPEVLRTVTPGSRWREGYGRLVELFVDLTCAEQKPGLLYEIARKYYQPVFERLYSDDYPKRQKDLDQVKALLDGYQDLRSFIDDATLDPPEESGQEYGSDRLILSTIHSSKGLEFDAVFVIGLAAGRFPHAAAGYGEQLEEERRLLYVAATRARKHLYLTYPRQMMSSDRQFHHTGMSPFLLELRSGLYDRLDGMETELSDVYHRSAPLAERAMPQREHRRKLKMSELSVGCRVSHPFFGSGSVEKLSDEKSLEVRFDRHGLKILHLDYARLTIL